MEPDLTADDACCAEACASNAAASLRRTNVRRGLHLEYLTVSWNVIEGVIALGAAVAAGSVALFGFGVDSFVESASGGILIWRLRSELLGSHDAPAIERLEHRARRWVAVSLFALAAAVAFDAARSLWQGDRPEPSIVGIALLSASIVVMLWLASAKRKAAKAIGSRALEADAFQTTACVYLSIAALVGIGLNWAVGFWWADPLAALVIGGLLVREGREAWLGRDCC